MFNPVHSGKTSTISTLPAVVFLLTLVTIQPVFPLLTSVSHRPTRPTVGQSYLCVSHCFLHSQHPVLSNPNLSSTCSSLTLHINTSSANVMIYQLKCVSSSVLSEDDEQLMVQILCRVHTRRRRLSTLSASDPLSLRELLCNAVTQFLPGRVSHRLIHAFLLPGRLLTPHRSETFTSLCTSQHTWDAFIYVVLASCIIRNSFFLNECPHALSRYCGCTVGDNQARNHTERGEMYLKISKTTNLWEAGGASHFYTVPQQRKAAEDSKQRDGNHRSHTRWGHWWRPHIGPDRKSANLLPLKVFWIIWTFCTRDDPRNEIRVNISWLTLNLKHLSAVILSSQSGATHQIYRTQHFIIWTCMFQSLSFTLQLCRHDILLFIYTGSVVFMMDVIDSTAQMDDRRTAGS